MSSINKITLIEDDFGMMENSDTKQMEMVKRYTFSNANGISIQVISYGATITTINVPDKNGKVADIVMGFDTLQDYITLNSPHFGSTIGRVCNRINKGQFNLNGIQYKLSINNNNKHHLHGGFDSFEKKNWTSFMQENKVTMTHSSPAGVEGNPGYPGNVFAMVTYELLNDNRFSVNYSAYTSEATPINMTNHSYFNLAGHNAGSDEFYEHFITINADRITETDTDSIPTGKFINVTGTPYDCRIPRQLGPAIANLRTCGFDDNFCITIGTDAKGLAFVALLEHKNSGRSMEIYSDQPGVQFYTGNFLPDPVNKIYPKGKQQSAKAPNPSEPIRGKNGGFYYKHGSLCLETQVYPDAVNHANFPSTIVTPLKPYSHQFVYKFIINK